MNTRLAALATLLIFDVGAATRLDSTDRKAVPAKPVAAHLHHGHETSPQPTKIDPWLAGGYRHRLASEVPPQPILAAKRNIKQGFQLEDANSFATNANQVNGETRSTACDHPSQLTALSGTELVSAIHGAELTTCMYGLYDTSLAGATLFSDANLLTVVEALNDQMVNYDASQVQQAEQVEKLVTFLRAMHWVEGTDRTFTPEYRATLELVFDRYFAGTHFSQFTGSTTRNFMVRYEILVLLNSSGTDRQSYLPRFSQAIAGYAMSVSRSNDWGVYYEEQGMTRLLSHLFEATVYQAEATASTLATHPEIIDNLINFVLADGLWLVDHTRQYQWSDSVNELARMLSFGGAIADKVRPTIQHILATYSFDGIGADGWINAQAMVAEFDSANCHLYGDACAFDLEAEVLSGHHVCSDTLKLRYQGVITDNNLTSICSSLAAQELEFHHIFGTNANTPVANDENDDLEVVIFESSTQYENYAGRFFGINTDNGGMYLEGTPSDSDNQARFIAFQATWLPEFAVWNLEHEYIHYLDGRFNKWGDFNDQAANSVWWGEGIAEYLSQPDANGNALREAERNTYSLSELFNTTYDNSDTARIYYWGYLAVRFMFERHDSEIMNELLPSMRAAKRQVSSAPCSFDWSWRTKDEALEQGWYWAYDDSEWSTGYWVWTCGQIAEDMDPLPPFTPYQEVLDGWNSRFDAEFEDWLVCLVAGEGQCHDSIANPADLDANGVVDRRDVQAFNRLLRRGETLGAEYDFNQDTQVDRRDIRALSAQCTFARCAIAD